MSTTTSRTDPTRALRASAVSGFAAAVLILAGTVLSSRGMPSAGAEATLWVHWVEEEERAIETGVYYLLIPGLLLFLVLLAALAQVPVASRISTQLASWGGLVFVVCMAISGVVSSTSASTIGFFDGFEDPKALTVLTGMSAGFHLAVIAVWSLALTMAATAVGLHASGFISGRLRTASLIVAALTVAVGEVGAGLLPALLWMVFISVMLMRKAGTAVPSAAPAEQDPELRPGNRREETR